MFNDRICLLFPSLGQRKYKFDLGITLLLPMKKTKQKNTPILRLLLIRSITDAMSLAIRKKAASFKSQLWEISGWRAFHQISIMVDGGKFNSDSHFTKSTFITRKRKKIHVSL